MTETWFETNSVINVPGYQAYHTVRDGARSGGVSVYVADHISSRILPQYSLINLSIESCAVEILVNGLVFYIIEVYRPHSDTTDNFVSSLEDIMSANLFNEKPVILMGDLNLDLLKDSNPTMRFTNFMQSHHFLPLISKPTRIPSLTLLDQIWFNRLNHCNSGIILSDITDHMPTFVNIPSFEIKYEDKIKITFRLEDEIGKSKFSEFLSNFNWNTVRSDNVDIYAESFVNKLNEFYIKSFPLKTKFISRKRSAAPWMTDELFSLVKKKSLFFSLYRKGLITKQENNALKNKINTIVAKTKIKYYKNKFFLCKNDLKRTWKNIKAITGTGGNKKTTIDSLVYEGNIFSDQKQICNVFNKYFCEIGSVVENSIPPPTTDPLSYLESPVPESFFLFPVSPAECSNIINNLKNTKQDRDSISMNILKTNREKIASLFCDLVNLCFTSGKFPKIFKDAIILAILKKGDPSDPLNYRPISLLNIFCKILEKCIHVRISKFVSKHKLISKHQFGFQAGLSTENAVSAFCEFIYNALNDRNFSINIFIDLKKAYETVNRQILIKKLYYYGFRGVPLDLLSDYLSFRTQVVKIGDQVSDRREILTGLPTGSVLSCILFLIYVNDLPNISSKFTPVLFADDTTLSFRGSCMEEVVLTSNAELVKFSEWTRANRLMVNTDKTFHIDISTRSFSPSNIYFDGALIENNSSGRFLGVLVDNKMNFKSHIDEVCKKVSRSIGILY